jgi:organic radical activating enzyme
MRVKGILDEDFVNYKLPSMFISTSTCSFKCDRESGESCCQNSSLAQAQAFDVEDDNIISRYLQNHITKAIVFGGLEPFDQFDELTHFVSALRAAGCRDDVVIYTGYNKQEISQEVWVLSAFPNVIVKFGRYIPNSQPRLDGVLGVMLASKNQYAEKIS